MQWILLRTTSSLSFIDLFPIYYFMPYGVVHYPVNTGYRSPRTLLSLRGEYNLQLSSHTGRPSGFF